MRQELQRRISGKRVTMVGVGNPLRGDDGVGPALIDQLQGKVDAVLVDASDVPENYLGIVQLSRPEVIVIIDAVELDARAGDVALIELEQIGGTMATTHNTSLEPFAKMLRAETGADVLLVAIQPANRTFGAPMSPAVVATLEQLGKIFQGLA